MQECCRISSLSDAVFRCQDKQENSRVSWRSNNYLYRLIKSLLNEKDEKKKNIFMKIFELTFLECLEHFRGTKYIKELNNMTKYEVRG